MARSPAHKFGQIIGELVEESILAILRDFAEKHNLYLDCQGSRPARTGKKVTWMDEEGNYHDLDFVLEKDGTIDKIGKPVAFIEVAWRRYTKHSRNKAQEIQGAILPLSIKHRHSLPFLGVILSGVFTEGALNQMRSVGFNVLYFSYDSIVRAFASAGIDAHYDETTPEKAFKPKIKAFESISASQRAAIKNAIYDANLDSIQQFMKELEKAVTRRIEKIRVIALQGKIFEQPDVSAIINFIRTYEAKNDGYDLMKYEITIKYNTGDKIEAAFGDSEEAIKFLEQYREIKFEISNPEQK